MLIEDPEARLSWGSDDGEPTSITGPGAVWQSQDEVSPAEWAERLGIDLQFHRTGVWAGALVAPGQLAHSPGSGDTGVLTLRGQRHAVTLLRHRLTDGPPSGPAGTIGGSATIGGGATIGGQDPPRMDVIEFTGEGAFPWDLATDDAEGSAVTSSEISGTSAAVSRTTSRDAQLRALDIIEGLAKEVEDAAEDDHERYMAHAVVEAIPLLRERAGERPASGATAGLLHIVHAVGEELDRLPVAGPAKRLGQAVLEAVRIYRREAG